jgi:hypothetical protein
VGVCDTVGGDGGACGGDTLDSDIRIIPIIRISWISTVRMEEVTQLIYKKQTYILRGIFYEVQNELGRYRNEKQYADAIEIRLKEKAITYEREKVLKEHFFGERKGRNRIDFLVYH